MVHLMLQHHCRVAEDLTAEVGDGQQAPRNKEDTKAFRTGMLLCSVMRRQNSLSANQTSERVCPIWWNPQGLHALQLPGYQHVAPSCCPFRSKFWMIRRRIERIAANASSTFCGYARASVDTSLCPQFMGRKNLVGDRILWQSDVGATGLKASSFHLIATSSKAVAGLTSEFRASSSCMCTPKKRGLDIILSMAHHQAHEGNRASPLPSLTFFFILPFLMGSQNDCLDPLHLVFRNKMSCSSVSGCCSSHLMLLLRL